MKRGRPAATVAPGDVYPAGTVVREIDRRGKHRRFLVRRDCGHVVPVAMGGLQRRTVRCRACALGATADRARERHAERRDARRAAYVRARTRSYECGPGGLFSELTLHVAEPEPSGIRSLDELRRAIGPDAWDLCGAVRATLATEAA